MAWGGWSSPAVVQWYKGAVVQRYTHLGTGALVSCVAALDTRKMRIRLLAAFLSPGLFWSACFGADHGGRRAFKLDAATGRGSSNLVNAAGS